MTTLGRSPSPKREPSQRQQASTAPDDLDLAILDLLKADGRLSTRAIGRQLGVAAGTVGQRIARLEAAGVIQGYTAVIDPARLGRSLAFVVGLQITQGNDLDVVLDELIALPEVDRVMVVTGQWDVAVLGRVGDTVQLNEFLIERLWKSPSFRHSETMLVVNQRRTDGYL